MPWRTAPAWPVMPPPCTLTLMSNVVGVLGSSSGWRTIMRAGLAAEELVDGLPLTVIWPLPFLMKTRATDGLAAAGAVVAFLDHCRLLRFERLGLLRGVRMRAAGVHLQLAEHLPVTHHPRARLAT